MKNLADRLRSQLQDIQPQAGKAKYPQYNKEQYDTLKANSDLLKKLANGELTRKQVQGFLSHYDSLRHYEGLAGGAKIPKELKDVDPKFGEEILTIAMQCSDMRSNKYKEWANQVSDHLEQHWGSATNQEKPLQQQGKILCDEFNKVIDSMKVEDLDETEIMTEEHLENVIVILESSKFLVALGKVGDDKRTFLKAVKTFFETGGGESREELLKNIEKEFGEGAFDINLVDPNMAMDALDSILYSQQPADDAGTVEPIQGRGRSYTFAGGSEQQEDVFVRGRSASVLHYLQQQGGGAE